MISEYSFYGRIKGFFEATGQIAPCGVAFKLTNEISLLF